MTTWALPERLPSFPASATVADFAPYVRTLASTASWPTYQPHVHALVESIGPTQIREVTASDLIWLLNAIHQRSGVQVVDRARRTHRRLRSYQPSSHGYGAAENFATTARWFFRMAVAANIIDRSPASGLKAPRRPPPPERALTEDELTDIRWAAENTGDDPELDLLVLDLARHTAARRRALVDLRCGQIDLTRGAVTLSEKNRVVHEVPTSRALLAAALDHAARRGASTDGDHVLRYRDGHAITRRRFNTLFDRVDAHTSWSAPLDVGVHWIRHTTLTDIATAAGIRVAAEYAGHSPDSLGTIGRYTRVPFEELVAAYELVFGARG